MDLNFTLGVEEEFLIVDADTGELRSRGEVLLPTARERLGQEVQTELNLSQIETGTPICKSLDEVRLELRRLRRELSAAAQEIGCQLIAAGTHPSAHWQEQRINPTKDRYRMLEEEFQLTARMQLVCGSHVHVGIPDPDLAIQVLDRVRPWLSVLLALSANSPFWLGVDSGYASYRTQVWAQWPLTGMPEPLGSRADYNQLVERLVTMGAIRDASFIYWDVRPSVRYETLEFRISDSCLSVDEAVMLAGIVRGLASTAAAEAVSGAPDPRLRGELVEAAKWRAARFGLGDALFDLEAARARPAVEVVKSLLDHVRPALEEVGDWEEVRTLVEQTLARGNGAARQRAAFAHSQSLGAVLNLLVAETTADLD